MKINTAIISTYIALGVALTTAAAPVAADNSKDLGKYVVHYNAIPTTLLSSQVAKTYGITRSKFHGMVTVSVLEKQAGARTQPIAANILGYAKNRHNQLTQLEWQEIQEQKAVYYISEFAITGGETLDFSLVIETPDQEKFNVRFSNEFFTE